MINTLSTRLSTYLYTLCQQVIHRLAFGPLPSSSQKKKKSTRAEKLRPPKGGPPKREPTPAPRAAQRGTARESPSDRAAYDAPLREPAGGSRMKRGAA